MSVIVLVEDNELNRDMLSRRLTRRGHKVVCAGDGLEALSVVAQEQPDVVLMDLGLPVMDGWEATRRLKADPATAPIPVIALTAHALSTDRDLAMAAGCVAFETKPVELERLLACIDTVLGKSA
jgi:CheY-like chemotaxis protein